MDEKMKAAFDAWLHDRGDAGEGRQASCDVVEWTLDYLRERQEPVAYHHSDYGVLELSRVKRAGWKPLYAHPAPSATVPEWQPIETAPKNETFLAVLSCGAMQTICTMRWPVAEAKNSRPDGREFHVERVTHWMPLPAAPSPDKENPHD